MRATLRITQGPSGDPYWLDAHFELDDVWIRYGDPALAASLAITLRRSPLGRIEISLSEITADWIGPSRSIVKIEFGRRERKLVLMMNSDASGRSNKFTITSTRLNRAELIQWTRKNLPVTESSD